MAVKLFYFTYFAKKALVESRRAGGQWVADEEMQAGCCLHLRGLGVLNNLSELDGQVYLCGLISFFVFFFYFFLFKFFFTIFFFIFASDFCLLFLSENFFSFLLTFSGSENFFILVISAFGSFFFQFRNLLGPSSGVCLFSL